MAVTPVNPAGTSICSPLLSPQAVTVPPDLNARLRRILDRDREAAEQLRIEMDSLRERLAGTRQLMRTQSARTGAIGPVR